MKIIVVGAGIAGLYAAMRILNKYDNAHVTILEKASYIGGRIKTVTHQGVTMDAGAARFNDNHKRLFKLFAELGISKDKDMWPLTTQKIYIKDTHKFDIKTNQHIKHIITLAENTDPNHLKHITLKMFMKEHLKDSVVDDIIYSFGYNTEFDLMNAYDAVKIFKTDFLDDEIQYYVLRDGMDLLIKKLVSRLEASGRCEISLQQGVCDVGKGYVVVDNDKKIHCDLVVLAITKKTLEALPGLKSNKILQKSLSTLANGELMRVFSKFPVENKTQKVWFHDIPRVTTNNFVRYIIPLNYEKGSIMVSYTDGSYAREWNMLPNLKENIMKNLRKLFPRKDIPEPLWMRAFYWDEGSHCWLPGARKYRNTKDTVKEHGYIICGEVISDHNQAWIEGALETVDNGLKCLHF
jgi:protoporphyrinogen oxidase